MPSSKNNVLVHRTACNENSCNGLVFVLLTASSFIMWMTLNHTGVFHHAIYHPKVYHPVLLIKLFLKKVKDWTSQNNKYCIAPCDLFLDRFRIGFSKQIQQSTAEVMCVAVRVAKLIGNRVQVQISTCKTQHTELVFRTNSLTLQYKV